jgi:hypothetical protein
LGLDDESAYVDGFTELIDELVEFDEGLEIFRGLEEEFWGLNGLEWGLKELEIRDLGEIFVERNVGFVGVVGLDVVEKLEATGECEGTKAFGRLA